MAIFGNKGNGQSSQADLHELEASVQLVRRRMGDAKMPLDQLFKLLGEDDPQVIASIRRAREAQEAALLDGTETVEPSPR